MSGSIAVSVDGPIGYLVFDHAERRNALTFDMWSQIPAAVRQLCDETTVRVIVLRGAGKEAFVSGADISEFAKYRSGAAAREYDRVNDDAFNAIAAAPKPVIAMIHGPCVGGGVAIALCADLRYAADSALFALPPARLGLAYPASGIESLVRIVGEPVAKEIFFTARRFSAEEALSRHLVHDVFAADELEPRVSKIALTIARNAPLTVHSAKVVMRELSKPRSERDFEAIQRSVDACYSSEDYEEGVRAFLEKRAPTFHGR